MLFHKGGMHMEENKKENHEEKVKIYDKDMYISQEKLKTIAFIIIIFIIGFLAGYFSGTFMNQDVGNIEGPDKNIESQN